MKEIAVLDYGIGNIRSIRNALTKVGGTPVVTRDPEVIMKAAGLIIPGVGAFQHGMENLSQYSMVDVIKDYVSTGKPVLGICLGMQLMLSSSEENGFREGLNLVPGTVTKIALPEESDLRLPHIRWSQIHPQAGARTWNGPLLDSSHQDQYYYFVHSYCAHPENKDHILAVTEYGDVEITAAIKNGNVMGCQFHPEKSGTQGLSILTNFISLAYNPSEQKSNQR
ncbi:imidazole glycerol phosphate synthase subunit HisH [Emcibacter sp.]|uniref:imidazole glycerol phosphate synthase subunit HisH n=1 Tax=Emcibacter sp. TaxID=1979954 RepID=UPI003A8D3C81